MTQVITVGGQRFYPLENQNGETIWIPSVTTILSACYPKSQFLIDWQIDKGKEEAERILKEAGDEGTFIHERVEWLCKGLSVLTENLTPKQAKNLMAFVSWHNEVKPNVLGNEIKVYDVERGFAGTIDMLAEIDGVPYIIDIKTSNALHPNYNAQVAAYAEAYSSYMKSTGQLKAGILHLNAKTKKGWSFREVNVEKDWEMFDLCRKMFQHLYPNALPKQIELPDSLSLTNK